MIKLFHAIHVCGEPTGSQPAWPEEVSGILANSLAEEGLTQSAHTLWAQKHGKNSFSATSIGMNGAPSRNIQIKQEHCSVFTLPSENSNTYSTDINRNCWRCFTFRMFHPFHAYIVKLVYWCIGTPLYVDPCWPSQQKFGLQTVVCALVSNMHFGNTS